MYGGTLGGRYGGGRRDGVYVCMCVCVCQYLCMCACACVLVTIQSFVLHTCIPLTACISCSLPLCSAAVRPASEQETMQTEDVAVAVPVPVAVVVALVVAVAVAVVVTGASKRKGVGPKGERADLRVRHSICGSDCLLPSFSISFPLVVALAVTVAGMGGRYLKKN